MTYRNELFNLSESKFTCGGFLVDPKANLISRNNKEKRLEAKHIALLCYMASRPNEVISRKELASNVWPSSVVVEEVITSAIFVLRNALGDDAKKPKYIETIPKKGYRFIAQVLPIDDRRFTPQREKKTEKSYRSDKMKALITIGVASSFALFSILVFWSMIDQQERNFSIETIRPLTYLKGTEKDMAIHFPSQQMAYVHTEKHAETYSEDIYITNLLTQHSERLTNNLWRPQSLNWINKDSLAYIHCAREKKNICEIVSHKVGNEAITILKIREILFDLELGVGELPALFVSFLNDNENILFELDLSTGDYSDLREKYINLPRKIRFPRYSEDGNQLFMLRYESEEPSLVYLDLKSGELTALPHRFALISGYSLIDEERLLVLGTRNGTHGLWAVQRDNTIPILIHRAETDNVFTHAILDPSEREIFLQNHRDNNDINLITVETGVADSLNALNSSYPDRRAIFSKNGQSIYFFSNRSGYYEVWRYSVLDNSITQVTQLKSLEPIQTVVSDDELFIATFSRITKHEMSIIDVRTGLTMSQRFVPRSYQLLSWSRDGNSVYIGDRSGTRDLIRFDKKTLSPEVVYSGVNRYAKEVADGKSIRFTTLERSISQLFFTNSRVVEVLKIPKSIATVQHLRTRFHGDNIYITYIDRNNDTNHIRRFVVGHKNTSSPTGELVLSLGSAHTIRDINQDATTVLTSHSLPDGGIVKLLLR